MPFFNHATGRPRGQGRGSSSSLGNIQERGSSRGRGRGSGRAGAKSEAEEVVWPEAEETVGAEAKVEETVMEVEAEEAVGAEVEEVVRDEAKAEEAVNKYGAVTRRCNGKRLSQIMTRLLPPFLFQSQLMQPSVFLKMPSPLTTSTCLWTTPLYSFWWVRPTTTQTS